MQTGQTVTLTGTIEHDERQRTKPAAYADTYDGPRTGTVVAWMQGNGPYAIVELPDGSFATCQLKHITRSV